MARMADGCRKKPNGRIEKRFVVNGKRYSVSGKTAKECKEKEKAKREELARKAYTRNADITLAAYYEEWSKNREGVVKYSTTMRNKGRFDKHIKPVLGDCKIVDIEKRQIQHLQRDLAQKLKPSTVNCVMITLQTVLNGAVDDEIIDRNPCDRVKPLRTDDQDQARDTIHRALTKEEQKLFLQDLKQHDEYLYEFAYFSVCTGMRIMEVNALTWGDIDYFSNCIHVTKTLVDDEVNHKFIVTPPKSKASKRDIPMTPIIKKILEQQREKTLQVRGKRAVKMDSSIFTTLSGSVIQSTPFRVLVKRSIKRIDAEHDVEIEIFTHHALRATFATRYLEAGGNIQTLKTLLGHSSLKMTADQYAHVLQDTKQKEMNEVSFIFGDVADL